MKLLLKKYFISHPGNDYKPHFLRRDKIIFACLAALTIELVFALGVSNVLPVSRLSGVILVNALVDQTNENRVTENIPMLRLNPLLQAAAQKKADDMAKNDYFAHTSPSGVTPWYWIESVGYDFSYAGENLAVNFSDSEDVTNAWMNSPTHRTNILNGNFTEIGIAMAQGEFEGRPATYVVQFFGAPAKPAAFASAATQAKVATKIVAADGYNTMNSKESFIAVKGAETEVTNKNALPVALENNPVQNAAANPRRVANGFYILFAMLFALTLLVNLFAKLHLRHPKLVLSGVFVIVLMASLVMLNQYLFLRVVIS